MSAYIKTLLDNNGDIIYPQTKVEAIFDADGKPLTEVLSSSEGVDNTVAFNTDGSITENYVDGTSKTTVFNDDGSIVTTHYKNSIVSLIETVVFNSDGTISITYTKGSGN